MVWTSRVAQLDETDGRRGSDNQAAEDATARRLLLVHEAFDSGEWERGTNLLLPVAAPAWAHYPGEGELMLAFRPEIAVALRRLGSDYSGIGASRYPRTFCWTFCS